MPPHRISHQVSNGVFATFGQSFLRKLASLAKHCQHKTSILRPHGTKVDGFKMQTYLTLKELRAKLGGRSRSAIYLDLEAGRLPQPLKLGGRLYWPESDLDGHLRTLQEQAS